MHSLLLEHEEGKALYDECEFESVGSILRRMRAGCGAQMTPHFNLSLSLTIDALVQQEEGLCFLGEEGQP